MIEAQTQNNAACFFKDYGDIGNIELLPFITYSKVRRKMSKTNAPEVQAWYESEDDSSFKVVATDDKNVEIQYFDGTLAEVDLETWFEMKVVQVEAPEDWTGPFDDLEKDDLGDTEQARNYDNWSDPLDTVE